eukprot:194695-Pleurochrysis_carterae.AAC.5
MRQSAPSQHDFCQRLMAQGIFFFNYARASESGHLDSSEREKAIGFPVDVTAEKASASPGLQSCWRSRLRTPLQESM